MFHDRADKFLEQRERRIGDHDVALIQVSDAFAAAEVSVPFKFPDPAVRLKKLRYFLVGHVGIPHVVPADVHQVCMVGVQVCLA